MTEAQLALLADTRMSSEARFGLSPHYGIQDARDAHEWFLEMMRSHEEFEVMTDKPGEWPVPVWSETVRRVVVE